MKSYERAMIIVTLMLMVGIVMIRNSFPWHFIGEAKEQYERSKHEKLPVSQ